MPYDALGNYIPGDEPTVDQMQYELAKKGHTPRPLDKVTDHFKSIVTQFNPIMIPKLMQDVGTMGTNIVSPIVSPYVDILHNIQASGAAGLHRLAGDEQSALEAEARQRQVTPSSLYREPSLPVVREAEQGLGQAFEASKLPPLGPGSGMPGSAPVSPRPLLTPNDLRVLGAEATRIGRQVGEIPTDFANAQSGLQRIDPVTGQPVLGARIQTGVDRLGDIMEQRRMQGLTPIPGLPAALQPETSMFAVRPQGSRLTTPTIPETARGYNPPIDPINDIFKEVVGLDPDRSQATPTVLHSLNRRVQIGNLPDERPAVNALRSFMEAKAKEMYPDAATPREALEIFNAIHYDQQSRHAVENKMFDEFLQTPEGQQFMPNAAPTEELAKRHEAATEGLKNMWGKYLIKNLGTEGNPLVKMAAEKGLTFLPAEDILRIAADEGYTTTQNRGKGGYPIQGTFAEPIKQAKTELEELNTKINEAAKRQNDLFQAAHIANVDPASMPEYLEARKQVETDTKKKNSLQKKLDNLTLASAYEAIEDASVKPAPAETMLKEMHAAERPFYPGLKEAAIRGEKGYKTSIGSLEYLGFVNAADKFYNDVLQGKIPADKAATYPVDKYIRENAEARIKIEQAEKAKIEQQKTNVMKSLFDSANALPDNKKFGNVGVVELTKDTPLDVANKEVAASTEALDICIGEGGSGKGTKNLFTGKKDPRYTPIVDLLTGEPNPKATRSTSGYVDSLQRGEQLPMFRDLETGMPIAALQFHVASAIGANGQPKFNIGYASGAGNGRIDTKYVNGVRDYLNSRADDINGIGNNLEDNTGIFDTTNKPSLSKARRYAQVSENEMKAVDWNTMPRFMTADDVKQAVKGVAPTPVPVVQQSQAMQESVAQLEGVLIDNIEFTIDNALLETGLPDPDRLERRLDATFNMMQDQYFRSFSNNPISSINGALDFLTRQIDSHTNSAGDLSQEMVTALSNYANELETARDDLISQQQREQQQVTQQPQTPPAEQLRQAMEPRLFAGNARVVNDALREYSGRLQNYAANQLQNGMSPVEIADNVRTKVNEYRNAVLRGPTINTQNFSADELGEYVSELRQMIDNAGRFIEAQQQPQTANLPAEVQQNIDRRNQHITNAYQTALTPNTGIDFVDTALSEFSDMLDSMATNMFGNGYNASEIAENLADRIHTEHMSLVAPDRIDARGLTPDEADIIRQRLNNAYGNLNMIREMGVPAAEQVGQTTERITTAIQTAFTPNTGSPTVDAWLSQYGDVLANQIVEFENAGNNTAEVASLIDNEIRGQLHSLLRLDEQQTGLTNVENLMARTRLETAIGNIRFNVIPPERGLEPLQELPVDFFEPDATHPANQRYTMQSAIDMARELFEQERIDANNFDIRSIEDSIHALREGLFDDERIRMLSPREQVSFSEDVAFRLQNMLDDIRGRRPDRNLVADPRDAREALDNALANIENDYGIEVANDALMMRQSISEHVNPGDELSEYVYQLRRNRPGMSEDLRQALDHMAEELESVSNEAPAPDNVFGITGRALPTPVPAQPATAPYRPLPTIISAMSDQALTADMSDQARINVQSQFELLTDTNSPEELRNIVSLARSYAMGPWENFSDVQREWLARNIEEYIGDNPPPNTPPEEPPATELEQHWRNNVFNGDLTERQALTSLNNLANNTNLSVEDLEALRSIVNDPDSPQFRVADDDTLRQYNNVIDQAIRQREPPATDNVFGATGQALRITDRDRELYAMLSDVIDNAIEEGAPLPDPTDGEAYAQLILDDEIGGEFTELTDTERRRLASIVRRYGADATLPPQGHKDGGRIRKYKKGGRVHQFPSVEQMKHELMMRRA